MARLPFVLGLVAASLVGCGADHRDGAPESELTNTPDPRDRARAGERPWEVVSNRGETYVPNVFYADASENEQIMPWTIDGHTMIDRLIYPTLGNPNLYVKSDPADELTMVLRIEDDAIAHLGPSRTAHPSGLTKVAFAQGDEIAFFLVAKPARLATESTSAVRPGSGIFRVTPTAIYENAEPPEMPARLRARHTMRFVFDRAAMADVPPGLYDARFEVRRGGAVHSNVYEYQYNAVAVYDRPSDEYTALEVTDTQVSTGLVYDTLTADKLDDFVNSVNAMEDPAVRRAAFITFNGDLHNGGAPGTLRQRSVAKTYNEEAKRIVRALKRLDLPIFLTTGNHDGYATLGHVPKAVKDVDRFLSDSLDRVVLGEPDRAWPGFSWPAYDAFLTATATTPGGLPRDIVSGGFERKTGDGYGSFVDVPRETRNMILYDGFYQWQKTYGPLNASWTFGKNRYVSMNSFELRQHRRTGWGMYTVNYGGSVSKVQLDWLDRELERGRAAGEDVIVLMHHDPRGGHGGKDFGYYSPILDYKGIAQSTVNYLLAEKLVPAICKQPDFSLSIEDRDSCMHDGLQEWMAPDDPFDRDGGGYFMSGIELLRRIAKSPQVRTLLLGHVHYNSLEVIREGESLVPNRLALDGATQRRNATVEAMNPIRRYAWERTLMPALTDVDTSTRTPLTVGSWDAWRSELGVMLSRTPSAFATLAAPSDEQLEGRELAVVRFTSGADLTSQKFGNDAMFGFSVMHVTKQTSMPRINRVTYFIHRGIDAYAKVETIDIDRTRTVASHDPTNPVERLFDW
jgi:hypothetical protein